MLIKHPEFEIRFDANVKLGTYLFNNRPHILGTIYRKGAKRVSHTVELNDALILIDVDENENVVSIEIMGECDLGDIKDEPSE